MINLDKKQKLEREIEELKIKIEEVRGNVIEDREGDKETKELEIIYSKLIEKKEEKEIELKEIISDMVSKSESLYDPVEAYKKELQAVNSHNNTVDLLQNTIAMIEQIDRNRKELKRSGILNGVVLSTMDGDIKSLRFNFKTLANGISKKDKSDIKAKIKKAGQELQDMRKKDKEEEERKKKYLAG